MQPQSTPAIPESPPCIGCGERGTDKGECWICDTRGTSIRCLRLFMVSHPHKVDAVSCHPLSDERMARPPVRLPGMPQICTQVASSIRQQPIHLPCVPKEGHVVPQPPVGAAPRRAAREPVPQPHVHARLLRQLERALPHLIRERLRREQLVVLVVKASLTRVAVEVVILQ